MSAAPSSSFFSSLGAALKLPLSPASNIFAGSSKRGISGIQNFDVLLTDRLEGLRPSSETDFLSLPWLSSGMSIVLASHSAVESLIPDLEQSPLTKRDEKWVSDFLDESAKLLDVCNGLREGVAQLEECQMLVHVVLHNLNVNSAAAFTESQLQKARKAVLDCQALTERPPGDDDQDLSWPERTSSSGSSGRLFSLERKRSNSWGGSKDKAALQRLQSKSSNGSSHGGSSSGSSLPELPENGSFGKSVKKAADQIPEIELLKSMTEKFLPPKGVDTSKGRNAFIAGIYAAKVTTVCVLGVVYVTLTSKAGGDGLSLLMSCSSQISRQFMWAAPLLDLLDRVAMEIGWQRKQAKLTSFLAELVRIDTSMSRLLDIIQAARAGRVFPMPARLEDEMREELTVLKQHLEDFEQGLNNLEEQVNELFRMLIASRTQLLDVLGSSKGLF